MATKNKASRRSAARTVRSAPKSGRVRPAKIARAIRTVSASRSKRAA